LMPRYLSIIEPILKKEGIPDDFKYLALAESGFDQRALSPAGAAGIWQFLKTTAKERGLEVTEEVDERYHVEKATIAACVYFRDAYAAYGSWSMVAASYNAGRAGVNRQITRQKLEDYYDLLFVEETGRYVFRILALKLIMESPDTYGFHLSKKDTYPVFQYKTVEVNSKIDNLADFAIANGTNYKLLKMFNPWLRETFLTNKEAKTYQIKIPTDRRIRNEGIN
jgi:membrane-bound lytic murein transglycosylase D